MENSISLFNIAEAKMRYAAASQSVRASNIAHADTPKYRAKDTITFQEYLTKASFGSSFSQPKSAQVIDEQAAARYLEPNGNSVSLEHEMAEAAKNKTSHEAALTTFKTAMDILRTSLGR